MTSVNDLPPEKNKPSSRGNVGLLIFFVIAMTLVMALTKQRQGGCGGNGGCCPSSTKQIERPQMPDANSLPDPSKNTSRYQQSSEPKEKE